MYLFKDKTSYLIIEKEKEINEQLLNKEIEFVDLNASTLILEINKNDGTFYILDEETLKQAWKYKKDNQEVILSKDLLIFGKTHNLRLVSSAPEVASQETIVIQDVSPSQQTLKTRYRQKLVKSGEKPFRRF